MNLIQGILEEIKGVYSIYLLFFIICTGLFTLFFEANRLKKMELKREEIFARVIGAGYLVLSVGLYLAARYL